MRAYRSPEHAQEEIFALVCSQGPKRKEKKRGGGISEKRVVTDVIFFQVILTLYSFLEIHYGIAVYYSKGAFTEDCRGASTGLCE